MKLISGLDIVEIKRLADLNAGIKARFLSRIFTPAEMDLSHQDASLCGRFAAKEAAAKALGCGIGTIHWHDLEILNDINGAPQLVLHGRAQVLAAGMGISEWSTSITHTAGMAAAQVIGIGME